MADPRLTPEEKLLRVIESPNKFAKRGMRVQRRPQDFRLSLKLFKARHKIRLQDLLNLKTVNAILGFLAAAGTLFLLLDFWMGMPRIKKVQRLETAARTLDIGNLNIEKLGPLTYYLQEIGGRNIFALAAVSKTAEADSAEPSIELTNLIDGLRVAGIIWSEAPQAIIEDIKTGETYLLNRGGKLKQARVKEILKDRVILSYHDEEIELK